MVNPLSVQQSVVSDWLEIERLCSTLHVQFRDEDILNADETGLFYNPRQDIDILRRNMRGRIILTSSKLRIIVNDLETNVPDVLKMYICQWIMRALIKHG